VEIWERILDRYGWPALILVALSWVIYKVAVKVLIPYVQRQDERVEESHKVIVEVLNTQLEESRRARTTEVDKFVQTVNGFDARNVASQRETVEAMRALTEEVRRGGKRAGN
jgi:hypothetical protein